LLFYYITFVFVYGNFGNVLVIFLAIFIKHEQTIVFGFEN